MEHVGSGQGRAGPARHHGLRMHSQAHRAPAVWAHDSGGERLTAAWSHHMPRLWGTPELKDKQAEGEDWRWKEWHGMGSSTMAQVDKQERAARQAKTLGGQELRGG